MTTTLIRLPSLKSPENYELWSNNMAGALGSSGHWVLIDGPASRREPPALKSTDDDNERIELIWQRDERRAKHFSHIQAYIALQYATTARRRKGWRHT